MPDPWPAAPLCPRCEAPAIPCGRCHVCGALLKTCLDGEEYCPTCEAYRRYRSHGWARGVAEESPCPRQG